MENQKTANTQKAQTATVEKMSPALVKAQAVRQAESARREKLSPETLFKEDLTDVTNRVADLIQAQRGCLLGVAARGVQSGALKPEQVYKALEYIQTAVQRVRDELTVPAKQDFSL